MVEDDTEEKFIEDLSDETEDTNAITRSIHIETRYAVVTITTQAEDETIDKIRKIAEKLIDKYNKGRNDDSVY